MVPALQFVGYSDSDRGIIGSNMHSDGSLWKLLYMHAPESCKS